MSNILLRSIIDLLAKLSGTIVVGIQHDQNPSILATFRRCQKQLPTELFILM
jgi:hypothetical protein